MRKPRSPSLEENTEVKFTRESSRREEEGVTKRKEDKAPGRSTKLRVVTSLTEEEKEATVVEHQLRVVGTAPVMVVLHPLRS